MTRADVRFIVYWVGACAAGAAFVLAIAIVANRTTRWLHRAPEPEKVEKPTATFVIPGQRIGEAIGAGIVAGFEEAGKSILSEFEKERIEFRLCVTNPANWKVVTDGYHFTAHFYQPSTGWQPYGLFPVQTNRAATEKDIAFYINYFIGKQALATKQWTDATNATTNLTNAHDP